MMKVTNGEPLREFYLGKDMTIRFDFKKGFPSLLAI